MKAKGNYNYFHKKTVGCQRLRGAMDTKVVVYIDDEFVQLLSLITSESTIY